MITVDSPDYLITLREGQNTLGVILKGKPGGEITIQITQQVSIITPEMSIAQTANALRTADISLVLMGSESGDKTRTIITNLNSADRKQLASWIENGELAYPVEEITVAGNLKEMLHNIEMVGNDLEMRGRISAPTLKLAKMTVSGE